MAGNGPWSVKGIDPKARAVAKEAAQRAGLTLGQWLSHKMLEAGVPQSGSFAPDPLAESYRDPDRIPGVLPAWGEHRGPSEPHRFTEVEALARRLEATEHRSTLAITGIDQTVLGLLARLEGVEKSQTDVTDRLTQSLETLDVRLEQSDQQVEEFSIKISRELKDTARRIDTIGEQSDTNASAMRHELGKDVELINNRSDEISQRLAVAEKQTDNALRTLEASFVSISERLSGAETTLQNNSDTGLSEKFDKRFSLISNELIKVVAETRGQLAAQIEAQAANPKLAQMEDAIGRIREKFANTENRHANTLEQIAVAVSKLGTAVETRLEQAEQRNESRLVDLQQDQALALEKVGQSMADVALRLEARFDQADKTATEQSAREDLEARLRESEVRTGQLVEEALQRVHQRLDDAVDQSAADISPVQRALNNLTDRLGVLEDRKTPPFADQLDETGLTLPRSDAPDDWNSVDVDATQTVGERVEPVAPYEGQEYSRESSSFEQPGLPPLGELGGFDGPDEFGALPEFSPETYIPVEGGMYDNHPLASDQTVGATADQNFMAAARRSMQENASQANAQQTLYPSGQPAPGQMTKAKAEQKGSSKKILVAASVFAIMAIGAAASMTLLDGRGGSTTNEPSIAARQPVAPSPADDVLNGTATKMARATETPEPETIADLPEEPKPVEVAEVTVETSPSPVRANPVPPKSRVVPEQQQAEQSRNPEFDRPYSPPASQQASRKPVVSQKTNTPPRPVRVATTRPSVSGDPNVPISLVHTNTTQAQRPSMEQAAAAGDPIAQYQYAGSLVDSGQPEHAAQMMKQAANRGLPAAQYQLAKYYENGTGVAVDDRESRRWTERAANGGNRRAMHNLAMFFAEGRAVPQSYENAAKWFEEASLLGLANSQFNLALLYEQGLGVPKSLPDAFAWYSIAAKAGDRGAAQKVTEMRSQLPADAAAEADTITARFRPRPLDMAANGVFQNINWARPQVNDPTSVSRSQILLARLGYNPGPADGNMGEQTRLAIISYEQDNGLAQTGRMDAALLSKLENSAAN